MDDQFQEDWLETRLCEEATYIDDAGFTALVVRQLPAQRAARITPTVVALRAMAADVVTGELTAEHEE